MNRIKLRNPLRAFFCLTFGISWAFWIPQIIIAKDIPALRIIGTFGPLFSALLITTIEGGLSKLIQLIKPITVWRINITWYMFCFFSTAILAFTSIGIAFSLGNKNYIFNSLNEIYLVIPIFLYVLFFSVIGEEIGWRGFALPRMQKKYGALMASIYIGIIWGFWHLPLFFVNGNFHQDISFLLFMIQEVALSIVMTWLYNNTRNSLLPVHIFHAASNTTLGVLPILPMSTGGDTSVLTISVGLLIILALSIVLSGTLKKHTNSQGDIYG